MKKPFTLFVILLLIFSCQITVKEKFRGDLIQYVDPFIGTGGHGHTYPGASSPFGMVQLSPDTRLNGWDACSGYHYSDSIIYGFSHTHLSGTGVSDYGDVLLMPICGEAKYKNVEYASSFSHSNEIAQAGYYSVKLNKYNIGVELTTSPRTGMHKYSFAKEYDNKVILDLNHRDIALESYVEKVDDSILAGYRISKAWAQEQYLFFYMVFSQKIDTLEFFSDGKCSRMDSMRSKDIIASIGFNQVKGKVLQIKLGISAVDVEGAKKNLLAENKLWDFESLRKKNQNSWQKELSKVLVKDEDKKKKTIFYTALYHTLIVPNLFSDVDGRYRGMDKLIHSSNYDQYTVFSLWDTYRATHPLYTLIEQKRTNDFLHTFKNQYHAGGILPIWELAGNYTHCMIGYHAIPVIVDAYQKGLTDIAVDTLLKMVLSSANEDKQGLKAYKKNAYIAINDDAESVSKTLEYAYDDWCIAQLAKKAGQKEVYADFIERAQYYKNILDPQTGFMRPKLNQIWKTPFDPSEVDFNYTEANAWQYSFYVPQDIYSFMAMMGGRERFEKQLDSLFSASTETTGRQQSDISGMIGQYAHGNEPSHHIAYLYNYVNTPEKTQKYVNQIMDELYSDKPDGYCGNEDCGQMSAWYVFSAMGFYPVNPANGEYVFGTPLFDEITLKLETGKTFTIKKKGKGTIKSISLNGVPYDKAYITHSNLMAGGELVFQMSENGKLRYPSDGLPSSVISDSLILPIPAIRDGKRVFRDSTLLTIEAGNNVNVLYSLNGSKEKIYRQPILIDKSTSLTMRSVLGGNSSKTENAYFYKIPKGRCVKIKNKYQDQYSAGGEDALIDGLLGGGNFRNGSWQGYQYVDLDAVIDLGKAEIISQIGTNFIQDARSWIWMPQYVEYWGSSDSVYFFPLGKIYNTISKQDYQVKIKSFNGSS